MTVAGNPSTGLPAVPLPAPPANQAQAETASRPAIQVEPRTLGPVNDELSYLMALRTGLNQPARMLVPRDVRHGPVAIGVSGDEAAAARAGLELYRAVLDHSLGENRVHADRSRLINKVLDQLREDQVRGRDLRIHSVVPGDESSYIIEYSIPGSGFSGEMTIQKTPEGVWIILDIWLGEWAATDGDDPERNYPEENVRILQDGGMLR